MTAAPIERVDTIEHLDFDPEFPCEHGQHELGLFGHHGPAWAFVEVQPCPHCGDGDPVVITVCQGAWDDAAGGPRFRCRECLGLMAREQAWRFLELVKP